jgi:malate synthase
MEKYGGVFYYLPKMESYLEARLWEEIFTFSENYVKIPVGTIKVTVLIETLNACLEMEEIIYELRKHISACNAGRWDYIYSALKKTKYSKDSILPDRSEITM